jgi:hypothetical protein
MPELVDLPPELIEHIYIDVENLVYDELLDTDRKFDTIVPTFRLVNRYVEQCTRREFTLSYFGIHCIKAPDDASIGMFCAIAQVPDLAKSVVQLVFCVDMTYQCTNKAQRPRRKMLSTLRRRGCAFDCWRAAAACISPKQECYYQCAECLFQHRIAHFREQVARA